MVNNCRKIEAFEDNELHLWHINLLPYLQFDPNDLILNDTEILRKKRYVFEKHQLRFAACRKLLKLILANYLDLDIGLLDIEQANNGKPFLKGNPLKFNLSHSHDFMFLGITKNKEIGVDIEQIKHRDFVGLANHSFSELEKNTIINAPSAKQAEIFYKIWCQKEAFIKFDGRGLRYPLKDFSVCSQNDGGLISTKEICYPTVRCYQSAPHLFAAYCMDVKKINTHFFDNRFLETIMSR